ncbi:uncharacterized protein [Ranitomeya imitator]|uniref:uncharacterized protein n=1 Tax=Ranitomeya imitator TaxID=111125 RepID=UPI0037E815E7
MTSVCGTAVSQALSSALSGGGGEAQEEHWPESLRSALSLSLQGNFVELVPPPGRPLTRRDPGKDRTPRISALFSSFPRRSGAEESRCFPAHGAPPYLCAVIGCSLLCRRRRPRDRALAPLPPQRSDFAPFCSFFSFYIDFVLVSRFPDLRSVVRSPLPPVSAQPMFCDHKSAGGRCRCAAGLMAGSVFSVGLCTCEGLRMSPPCARRCRFCTGGKYLGIPVLARSAACPGHKDDEEHGGGGRRRRLSAEQCIQADAHSWSLFMEVIKK